MLNRTLKVWGNYVDWYRGKHLCIKVLNFLPNKRLSTQRHKYRYEFWWVVGTMNFKLIFPNEWHTFMTEDACQIFEIQFGRDVREDDIERV